MEDINNYNYLLSDLTKLSGVGKKTMEILKRKKETHVYLTSEGFHKLDYSIITMGNFEAIVRRSNQNWCFVT